MSKALVVDDSRAIRVILSRILGQHGFEVCEAGSGELGLAALRGAAADVSLVCIDYNMPEMNGLDMLREMRELPNLKHVPVVMITTETHMDTIAAAARHGAEYIMKPFTADMVVGKLRMMGILAEV